MYENICSRSDTEKNMVMTLDGQLSLRLQSGTATSSGKRPNQCCSATTTRLGFKHSHAEVLGSWYLTTALSISNLLLGQAVRGSRSWKKFDYNQLNPFTQRSPELGIF